MRTMLPLAALLSLATGAVALATPPALFGKSQPGMWELSGIEGMRSPYRMCVADLAELARVEHRGRDCEQKLLRETDSAAIFTYECAANDFGRSEISYVTARNFKIVSQGIAGGLPFSHTVQARRIGECEPGPALTSH